MKYITIAQGAAFPKDKEGNENRPDLSGSVDFEDNVYKSKKVHIALWKRNKNGSEYYSFKITELRDED